MSRFLYSVKIRPPLWEGYMYSVWCDKLHGNGYGLATEVKSKAELLALVRDMFRQWEKYDDCLQRMPDKVTRQNLRFESFTPEISVAELFGNSTLDRFLGGTPPPAPEGQRPK